MTRIRFGTDGWRSRMDVDFNEDSVRLVARAIAAYVLEKGEPSRGVVVGYDTRRNSRRFAEVVADVFRRLGVPVYMVKRPTPTPVVAFTVKSLGASGGVMITASHNPPEYNGIKFIPDYAGPASTEITSWIEERIEKGLLPELNPVPLAGLEEVSPEEEYFDHLEHLLKLGDLSELSVVYDPMYGTGLGYVDKLLREHGATVKVIHDEWDPSFKGLTPEPVEENLVELVDEVRASDALMGLANDGDADRFGLVEPVPGFIHPNKLLPAVAWYLLEERGLKGPIVRSVATTHILDRIAEDYGVKLIEVPVGFKWIAEVMMREGALLGCEESGGLSIIGHIPDKDGVLADLLLAEMVSRTSTSVSEIIAVLEDTYGKTYYRRLDIRVRPGARERLARMLAEALIRLEELAGLAVAKTITIDGVKLVLEDGSWLLVRPSGTEPLVRVYCEATSPELVERCIGKVVELVEGLHS